MTRKRFIKLAMARGYQRNQAAIMANTVEQLGTYTCLYSKIFAQLYYTNIPNISIIIGITTQQFTEAMRRAALVITNLSESLNRRLSEYGDN